jgi:hypothetical protein
MVTRYRHNPGSLLSPMLADQAGYWVMYDDVAFGASLTREEEQLIRLIRIGDFLNAGSLYGRLVQQRRAEDEAVVASLAGEHGRVDGLA